MKNFMVDLLKATNNTQIKDAVVVAGITKTTAYNIARNKYVPFPPTVEKILKNTGLNLLDYLDDEKVQIYKNRIDIKPLDEVIKPLLKAVELAGGIMQLKILSGVCKSSISRVIAGSGKLSKTSVEKIAEAVDMDVKEFEFICNHIESSPKPSEGNKLYSNNRKDPIQISYKYWDMANAKRNRTSKAISSAR